MEWGDVHWLLSAMLLLRLNCSHALEECLWRNVYGNSAKSLKISVRRGVCDRIEVTGQKGWTCRLAATMDIFHLVSSGERKCLSHFYSNTEMTPPLWVFFQLDIKRNMLQKALRLNSLAQWKANKTWPRWFLWARVGLPHEPYRACKALSREQRISHHLAFHAAEKSFQVYYSGDDLYLSKEWLIILRSRSSETDNAQAA